MTINTIIETITTNPVTALVDEKAYAALYAHIKAEVDAFVPDLSTESSRKEIASLAYKVTRTKTAIDAAGKKLNEEARAKINAVDAQRRKIRDDLDALAAQARQPLTEWEEAEEQRQADAAEIWTTIQNAAQVSIADTSDTVSARLRDLQSITLSEDLFRNSFADAQRDLAKAVAMLMDARERLLKAEADARELEALRAAAAAKEVAERQERERAEAERRAALQREQAAAEAKRREEAAAEAARMEERRRADEAIRRAEAEKQAAIAAAERKERERIAEEARKREEDERRAADKRHRAKIMRAASDAIAKLGIASELADKVILAIRAGDVPNVTLRF